MMNQRERSRHPDDYIDQAGDGIGWVPIAFGIAFVAVLGILLFIT